MNAPGRTAASAAAGGLPTAGAIAFVTAGRPALALVFGLVAAAAAAVTAVATSPAGEALARGHVARRLLRAAAAESRRTDVAQLQGAVSLLLAVGPEGSPSARLPLAGADAPPAFPGAPEPPAPEALPP